MLLLAEMSLQFLCTSCPGECGARSSPPHSPCMPSGAHLQPQACRTTVRLLAGGVINLLHVDACKQASDIPTVMCALLCPAGGHHLPGQLIAVAGQL